MIRRLTNLIAFGALSLFAAGCGDDLNPSAPTLPVASPTTSTFASTLPLQGSVSRVFATTQAGTVTVTLKSAGAPSTVVGLGIGIPYTGVANCALFSSSRTTAGTTPQITAPVDSGQYCVALYDVGALTSAVSFEITIVYP